MGSHCAMFSVDILCTSELSCTMSLPMLFAARDSVQTTLDNRILLVWVHLCVLIVELSDSLRKPHPQTHHFITHLLELDSRIQSSCEAPLPPNRSLPTGKSQVWSWMRLDTRTICSFTAPGSYCIAPSSKHRLKRRLLCARVFLPLTASFDIRPKLRQKPCTIGQYPLLSSQSHTGRSSDQIR